MPDRHVEIIGTAGSNEFRETDRFCDRLATVLLPWVKNSELRITAVPSFQCHGSRVQDIDQLIFLSVYPSASIPHRGGTVELDSVVFTLEVKSHRGAELRFEGQHLYVKYSDPTPHWVNVSEKIVLQAKSAARALKEIAKADCFVAGGVYLPNAAQEDIPATCPDIIGASFRVSHFVEFLAKSRAATTRDGVTRLRQKVEIDPVVDTLREALRPVVLSELNRKRVQRITERYARDQQFYQAVGNKLLIFQGKAGTGKTSFLVRLANDLSRQGKRCLFLTFNHALRIELLTLLSSEEAVDRLRRARVGVGGGAIPRVEVEGLNLFLQDALVEVGIIPNRFIPPPFEENYRARLKQLVALPSAKFEKLRKRESFDFDYVFLDEGQDIHEEERDALIAIFSREHLIVSVGHDQLVRPKICSWTKPGEEHLTHIKRGGKSLRMKQGIVRFVDRLAEFLGAVGYEPYEGAELPGGKVRIHTGKYSPEVHRAIMTELSSEESGGTPGDVLMAIHEFGSMNKGKELRKFLAENGDSFWDGTDDEVKRRCVPLRPEELRIANYKSVRGLECWSMICHRLDRYYTDSEASAAPIEGDVFYRQTRAFGLVAIACTRPVNSLIITLEDPDSDFSHACVNAALEDPEHCEVVGPPLGK
jgi:hypothetical protein